jgi:transcriptional regulator with XRE-family HTH domain
MNQYERGKHEPDFTMVERIAKVLNVPESYFYAKDDEAAWLQVVFHRMSGSERERVTQAVSRLVFQMDLPLREFPLNCCINYTHKSNLLYMHTAISYTTYS